MDDLGNRTGNQTLRGEDTVHFAVDTLTNRYTAVAGHPLAYDDAGNLTQDKDGYQFTYDCENRITRIYKDNNSDGSYNTGDTNIAEYAYDTQGRRIRVYDAVSDATTLYYYSDNWQVLSTVVGGSLDKSFIYGNYIDEVLVMNQGASDYFYLHDHLYSPTALLNSAGSIVERYEYDAYGKVRIMASDFSPRTASLYGNPFYFTGRELDSLDNGAYEKMHYRHRDYEPWMGRFFHRDPKGYVDSMSLYAYVVSNPISYVDPSGLSYYPIPLPPIPDPGRSWAIDKLKMIDSVLTSYDYYEITGLEQLINSRLIPTLQSSWLNIVVAGEDDHGWYQGLLHINLLSLGKRASEQTVFHEAIHAYLDLSGAKGQHNPRTNEGIATTASRMLGWPGDLLYPYSHLQSIEHELKKDKPNMPVLELWSAHWGSVNGRIIGTNVDVILRIISSKVEAKDVENVKATLGFSMACETLAAHYTGIVQKKGGQYGCVKFICDPVGGFKSHIGTGVLLNKVFK